MFSSRLCVILVLAINLVNALPILQTSGLERRVTDPPRSHSPSKWPTQEQLKGTLKTDPSKAEFWAGSTKDQTGSPVSAQNSAEEHARQHGGTTLEMALKDQGHTMPHWNKEDPATQDKWSEASEAFAHGASGHIHAHIGEDVRPDSVYTHQEKPILEKNPDVESITEHAHMQPDVPPTVVHTKGKKKE